MELSTAAFGIPPVAPIVKPADTQSPGNQKTASLKERIFAPILNLYTGIKNKVTVRPSFDKVSQFFVEKFGLVRTKASEGWSKIAELPILSRITSLFAKLPIGKKAEVSSTSPVSTQTDTPADSKPKTE
jgi:hypothetical protein